MVLTHIAWAAIVASVFRVSYDLQVRVWHAVHAYFLIFKYIHSIMKFSKTLSTCLKCIFISVFFLSSTVCVFAQLKKTAKIEKVKSFTAGSVALNKTSLDGVEVYSVTLPNN